MVTSDAPTRKASHDHGLRLRRLILAAEITLPSLTLLACLVMFITTVILDRRDTQVRRAAAQVRAVDDIRYDIQVFGSEDDQAVVAPSPEHDLAPVLREARLGRDLELARQHLDGSGRASAIDDLEQLAGRYVMSRRDVERKRGAIQDVLMAGDRPRRAAVEAADKLIEQNVADLGAAASSSHRWHQRARIIALVVGLLAAGGIVAIEIGKRRVIFRPIFELAAGIKRFASGDRRARIQATGVAELQDAAESFNELAGQLETQHDQMLGFVDAAAQRVRDSVLATREVLRELAPGRPLPAPDRIRQRADVAARQLTRVERLLADFVEASHVQFARLNLRLVRRDARDLARKAVELYQAASPVHQILLSTDEAPVPLECDPDRMGQLMSALVSEAVRRTPRGGVIEAESSRRSHRGGVIEVRVGRDGARAAIDVTDHGRGFTPTELEHLFEMEPSHLLHAGAMENVLGMSALQRIAQAHGGGIEVESSVEAGSTVHVRLPLAEEAQEGK